MTDRTPPVSIPASPFFRSTSPSPSISPSLALGACPELDRCVSDPSTISSSLSSRSVSAASDAGPGSSRRRGYMRPQGTAFSDSAKNRDSVMSLGSIAHMQYYFARTGLLDGKGGQLAKKARKQNSGLEPDIHILGDDDDYKENDGGSVPSDVSVEDQEPMMLPPTVSTYRAKVIDSQPPPDIDTLRRELQANLENARDVVAETLNAPDSPKIIVSEESSPATPTSTSDQQGWHEVQGLHILDTVTLAIRSAKDYYAFHSQPHALYAIRSEREIRSDLYQVLDVLKRMANRNFRGGVRGAERTGILQWIESISDLLQKETEREQEKEALRKQWQWLQGDWTGREREREWHFLSSFDTHADPLPAWDAAAGPEPTEFLKALASGLRLVHLHNELVKQSRRRFGQITSYYTDLGKPYRCADNLRYWIKAAELRWEIRLQVNVLDIVYSRGGEDTWAAFDNAILTWSQAVRKELADEWLGHSNSKGDFSDRPDMLGIEV